MTSFFSLSNSYIDKKEFLEVYRDVYAAASICAAPFGLLQIDDTDDRFDKQMKEDYMKVFTEWEEILSRAIFEQRGYTQDEIVTSVNKYITGSAIDTSIKPDEEVRKPSPAPHRYHSSSPIIRVITGYAEAPLDVAVLRPAPRHAISTHR